MLEYQTSWRVCINLGIIVALVRESKGINLSASIYFCVKWNTAAWAPYMEYCLGVLCPNMYYNTVSSADLSCSLVSSLVSVRHTMTLLIDKIAYDFASLRVLGEVCLFFMNVWEEILRQPAFPLQLSPQKKYIQVFVSSVLLHFFINVVTSWNVCLAPEAALSCVTLILFLSALVVQGTWEELWVSWVQCQHWWFNCRGQILCAIQMILALLESSPDAGEGI